ncbi:Unknown protein [Striga hermonthica]|uniref:KIB1-4 beta-propeller domain-containing protein n=1 Tax=Striga hermonthica TaxID=68872 RepID=A0A9N7N2X9_STRHE|nr:Unknown protein [Striga hermonthica]
MAYSFLLRRGRSVAGFSSYLISGKWSRDCNWFCRRGMSTAALMSPEKSNPSSSCSPWLMLQPVYEAGAVCTAATMTYKFYNLAENRVVTLWVPQIPCDLPSFRGSSGGGWVSIVQPETRDVLLYNPISRRRIKLPPFYGPSVYPGDKPGLHKSILSCSPDSEKCVAVSLIYCANSMAVCCPLSSDKWTWFGTRSGSGYYLDCVYSTSQQILFALTDSYQLEAWHLTVASPELIRTMGEYSSILERVEKEKKQEKNKKLLLSRDDLTCWSQHYLVVAGDDLLVVTQYIMLSVDSDGLYVDFDLDDSNRPAFELPTVTIDFDVHRYDPKDGDLKYVEGSCLGGWTLFVGNNSHSVALRAPELKPNSIYFTDPLEWLRQGNHDIGIFSYEDKAVSPCYYPCDPANLKPIFPAPICADSACAGSAQLKMTVASRGPRIAEVQLTLLAGAQHARPFSPPAAAQQQQHAAHSSARPAPVKRPNPQQLVWSGQLGFSDPLSTLGPIEC